MKNNVSIDKLRLFIAWILIIYLFYIFTNLIYSPFRQKIIGKSQFKNIIYEPKIFCMILTVEDNFNTKAKLIYEAWANECDNHKFISTISKKYYTKKQNNSDPIEININNFNVLQPPNFTNDSYRKLTEKVFKSFKYVYEKYPDYDFYLKADDDTYIFVDNLRLFLSDKNKSKPVTYGYDFHKFVDYGYHSGGAGYVLTNEALSRLALFLKNNYSSLILKNLEDVDVAETLRKVRVYPEKSIDDYGRERFHPLKLYDHYIGKYAYWMRRYSDNPLKKVNSKIKKKL